MVFLTLLDQINGGDLKSAIQADRKPFFKERYGRMILDNGLWHEALELSVSGGCKTAWRAAWALEWAYFHDPRPLCGMKGGFLEKYAEAGDPGVHRIFAKIMYDILHRKLISIDPRQAESVAVKTFDLLADPKTRVAVKAWAMDILYELSDTVEWIPENIAGLIRTEIARNPTAGMISRGNRILARVAAKGG